MARVSIGWHDDYGYTDVVSAQAVERVVLRGISWDLYTRLVKEIGHSPRTRVTYDSGLLQVVVVRAAPSRANLLLTSIVRLVAAETNSDVIDHGSITLQRPDLLKGFEPDSCFYFRHAAEMRSVDDIDLANHPPPELVLEADVANYSLDRFSLFTAVGVAEVWRHSGGIVNMYALRDGAYTEIANSIALPVLTAEAATHFVSSGRRTIWPVWTRELREWVRSQ